MKKVFLFSLVVMFVSLASCSKDDASNEPNPLPENGIITLVRDVELPGMTSRSEIPTITVVFDDNTETILSYEVSQSILDYIGMTAAELDDYLKEQMGEFYYLNGDVVSRSDTEPRVSHSQCITDCYNQFTDENGNKKPGRGSCKAGCWVESVLRFFDSLNPFS